MTEPAKPAKKFQWKIGHTMAVIGAISVLGIGGVVYAGVVVHPAEVKAKNLEACTIFQAGLEQAASQSSMLDSMKTVIVAAQNAVGVADENADFSQDLITIGLMQLQGVSETDNAQLTALLGYSKNVQNACAPLFNEVSSKK
ncbi:MAG: hypothetical protein RLY88_699 [Actinomycetota bacterium]|jgi:hypothetical protein